jgi:hypothetical protein
MVTTLRTRHDSSMALPAVQAADRKQGPNRQWWRPTWVMIAVAPAGRRQVGTGTSPGTEEWFA